jgi:alkylation response protein AidB-like acyl-CoA dehydrogenase
VGIGITEEHRELERVARDVLAKVDARGAGRALLEAEHVPARPPFWEEVVGLGWLGLHVPEAHGGSGYGLPELVVVVEALGRAVAPGPFVPTVIASAVVAACGSAAQQGQWLPGLVDGSTTGAFGFGDGLVLGGGGADVALVVRGDDVVVLEAPSRQTPEQIDRSRPSTTIDAGASAVADLLAGAAGHARAIARTILAAECAGGASECCEVAVAYAKERHQFGRPIGTYQAVKHHCADMLVAAEVATAAVWDAARASADGDVAGFELASAVAAVLAGPAFLENAHLNTQVHGGIGYTWEHDAHLLLRRAIAVAGVLEGDHAARQVLRSIREGAARVPQIDLGPEAESMRAAIRGFAEEVAALDPEAARRRLVETGYVMPHWPRPWGRGALPVEQLVIEEELARAGVVRPDYGMAAWVIPSLVQHGSPEQIERWVLPALRQEQIWCQMFSEPEAGSDAAGIRTRAERVDGGWRLNGQKVWTSRAHQAHLGLITVRTDPAAPKHKGITTMVLDMHADGVETRPLRQVDGDPEFNEVFLTDVFVPDADVVGEIDGGWRVARSTLGNERVSIGAGAGGGLGIPWDWVGLLDAHPDRAARVETDLARLLATDQALVLLNLRQATRAVAGAEPGPEGNLTKLVSAEQSHRRGFIGLRLVGSAAAFVEGEGAGTAMTHLRTRAMSIAGGTSEITRNQIGERLLGLPRDPLLQ